MADTSRRDPSTLPITTISGEPACTLQFVTGYVLQDATLSNGVAYVTSVANNANGVGAVITENAYNNPSGSPVQVRLLVDNSPPANSVAVTLTSGCSIANGTATTNTGGYATFNTLSGTAAGVACVLTASAPGFAPNATSNMFRLTAADGQVDCGQALSLTSTNPNSTLGVNDPGYAEGARGPNNKDGSSCQLVNYDFANYILQPDPLTGQSNFVSLKWDTTGSQAFAAFSYSANWKPVDFVDGFAPILRPNTAWKTDASGNPAYIYGVACTSSTFPAPVATLSALMSPSTANPTPETIFVTSSAALPATPFAVVIGIGASAERVKVVDTTAGSSWQAIRGDGLPAGTAVPGHASATVVMSTPLPLIPASAIPSSSSSYVAGEAARMCVFAHGWTSVTDPVSLTPKAMYSTSVFDIGDGWLSLQ